MYKIEITADTLAELAGKVMSLAVKLHPIADVERAYAPPAEPVEINPVAPAAPAPVVEAPAPVVEAPAPVADAPALSFEQVVAPVVLRAVATKSKAFVEGVMTEFGVARASQLDASRWAELIDRLESPF
jgi:hypothetical protein